MSRDGATGDKIVWDSEVKGLGLRSRGGVRSWIVQTRIEGYTRKRRIGDPGAMTRSEARAAAKVVLAKLRAGEEETPPSVAEFSERYLRDCAGRWKASTLKSHRRDFACYILPGLGAHRVDAVTRGMVIGWRDGLTVSAGGRNRCVAVLSGMMRHAELREVRAPGSNPCKGLRRRKSSFEARYLTEKEFRRVGRALTAFEARYPDEVAALRFIALTGCRKGEALGLRWDWLDGARFALPDSKSGPKAIWMGRAAREVVAARKPLGGALVFARLGKPLQGWRLDQVWAMVRGRSQLSGLRIHDLRHSFASVAVSNGVSLRTIARLLGHRDLNSAAAYAKFQTAATEAAAERVASHMKGLLGTKTPRRKSPARLRPDADARPVSPSERRKIVSAYYRARMGMVEFCAREGYDPDWLRRQLRLVRQDRAAVSDVAAPRVISLTV